MERYGKKKIEGDDELEMLLNEIPNEYNHHQYYNDSNPLYYVDGCDYGNVGLSESFVSSYCTLYDNNEPLGHCNNSYTNESSPVSGFSMPSDGSSSSLFSGGRLSSDNGSPTPPLLEEFRSPQVSCVSSYPEKGQLFDPEIMGLQISKENLMNEMDLCRSVNRMCIHNGGDESLNSNRARVYDQSIAKHVDSNKSVANARLEFCSGYEVQPSSSRSPTRLKGEMKSVFRNGMGDLFQLNNLNMLRSTQLQTPIEQTDQGDMKGRFLPNRNTFRMPSNVDPLYYAGKNSIALNEEQYAMHLHNLSQVNHARQQFGLGRRMGRGAEQPNLRPGESSSSRILAGNFKEMKGNVIFQGEGMNYKMNKEFNCTKVRSSFNRIVVGKHRERSSKLHRSTVNATRFEKSRSSWKYSPFSMPLKYNTLKEAQGNIYLIAKDQHGCRFLQHVFEEGSQKDVQIIFIEIIDHMVELMMNPFGNYLIQKLLEVCNEDQKMQVLLMATEHPGELVKISLNNHGTRVVQKLIDTLKTKEQISLIISALEHGFLALIKDLNGNHVVQHCLKSFSSEDNKCIFVAAAEHCVDIATHQHGCCVLQQCISQSTEEHRENLVTKIASNGLLLARDPYGNYVVQFILELKIPSATSIMVTQFEGNYVHLSTLQGGSHVVEKCLLLFEADNRSRIIHELLSTARFEQLIQDPHANYVIQMALQVSKGYLYNILAEEIESHRATSRNCPYSKKIYSQKLLRK